MIRPHGFCLLIPLFVLLAVSQPAFAQSEATAEYSVTFTGNWTLASTPGGVVGGAHFTTIAGGKHNSSVSFWAAGGTATAGLERLAELGITSGFINEINASTHTDDSFTSSVSGGGTGTSTFTLTVKKTHPLITLASMIGPSPDWFVGLHGFSLLDDDSNWKSSASMDLFPYDAGTEDGTDFTLSNDATSPQGVITSLKGVGKFSNVRMARISFTRQNAPPPGPTVSTYDPADGSTGVAVDKNLALTFDKSVQAGSGNIVIRPSSGTDIEIDVTSSQVSFSGSTVTINPSNDLNHATDYHVRIASGVIEDTSENAYAGIDDATTWNFSTVPTVSLSASPNPVTEGSNVTVTATLTSSLASDVTIPLTLTSGTAESGDYGTLSEIEISAEQTSGTGTISTTDDSDFDDETFTVALGNLPTTVGSGTPSSVLITITDADTAPAASLSVNPNPVTEGSSVTVTVTLTASLANDVTIPITLTRDTAESGDYGTLSDITITGGQTSGTGTLTTATDTDNDHERFTVSLGELPDPLIEGSPSSVQVAISDPDSTADPEVWLSASPNPVPEGTTVTVTATIMVAQANNVTIPVTLTNNTAESADYGTLTSVEIAADQTSGTASIATFTDPDVDDETFTVTLGDLPDGLAVGTPSFVGITISDPDTVDEDSDSTADDPPNEPPTVAATTGPHNLGMTGSLTLDLSMIFADPNDDTLMYAATSSDLMVATVTIDDEMLLVRAVALGASAITVTATDPDGESISLTFDVTVSEPEMVWYLPSTTNSEVQGFVRVINHTNAAGEVTVTATDDAGTTYAPMTMPLAARAVAHFTGSDLENGNSELGLLNEMGSGTGSGEGAWRMMLSSATLDIEALSYVRASDGFVTFMNATAPKDENGDHVIALFNPASDTTQMSRLRLVNSSTTATNVTVTGVDDAGLSPGEPVALTIPADTACEVDAAALETGAGLDCGEPQDGIGDGTGRWRLSVSTEADSSFAIMNLQANTSGRLTNLSELAGASDDGAWHVPLFPAAPRGATGENSVRLQGYLRVVNRSNESGTVTIVAADDSDFEYADLTLTLAANETKYINATDLELGNDAIGLSGSTGQGMGAWRLTLSSKDLEFDAYAYVQDADGFLVSMQTTAPSLDLVHRVAMFNPASNTREISTLRLVNNGNTEANALITGTDDTGGDRLGTTVRTTVLPGSAIKLTASELESGDASSIVSGALGDLTGSWRLRIEADQEIKVMSLLHSGLGHLSNLSHADDTQGFERTPAAVLASPEEVTLRRQLNNMLAARWSAVQNAKYEVHLLRGAERVWHTRGLTVLRWTWPVEQLAQGTYTVRVCTLNEDSECSAWTLSNEVTIN